MLPDVPSRVGGTTGHETKCLLGMNTRLALLKHYCHPSHQASLI